ncbi:competence protein [Bacillus methanolicus]|uniref:competence protein ComK n=1 Tax=Bacillus methanolicus TaxID=1471 RepID=UPI0023806180|nr:competence protein ComK [Bacillus methanolicus]MDE3840200.1 competence protein [Bacillus methanolicus]
MEKKTFHYELNPNTMAVLPIKDEKYASKILETDDVLYSVRTPIQLIKDACLEGGSTYEGRKRAVVYLTGTHNKIPVPVNPQLDMYAFPTESPRSFDCQWIFHNHVKRILPGKHRQGSIIVFSNQSRLHLDISYYALQKQLHRTAYTKFRFSSPEKVLT